MQDACCVRSLGVQGGTKILYLPSSSTVLPSTLPQEWTSIIACRSTVRQFFSIHEVRGLSPNQSGHHIALASDGHRGGQIPNLSQWRAVSSLLGLLRRIPVFTSVPGAAITILPPHGISRNQHGGEHSWENKEDWELTTSSEPLNQVVTDPP